MSLPEPGGETRSGFIALAGRPNVGKSTLANAIIGAKVAIVSDKPQTTRRAIRGIASGPEWQLVLVDLPGVQRPRDELTERMQRRVERELADADGCLLVLSALEGVGPGDRFIAQLLRSSTVPVIIAVNKIDRADQAKVVSTLEAAAELEVSDELFPVSARSGAGIGQLTDCLVGLLPAGPFYFESRQHSDQADELRLAELVREQVLRAHARGSAARGRGPGRSDPTGRADPDRGGRAHRDRVAEGDLDRRRRADDQVDRDRSTQGDRTRSCDARASGAQGPGQAALARGWKRSGPARDRLVPRFRH